MHLILHMSILQCKWNNHAGLSRKTDRLKFNRRMGKGQRFEMFDMKVAAVLIIVHTILENVGGKVG